MNDFDRATFIINKLKLTMPAPHQSSIVCPFPTPLRPYDLLKLSSTAYPPEALAAAFWRWDGRLTHMIDGSWETAYAVDCPSITVAMIRGVYAALNGEDNE